MAGLRLPVRQPHRTGGQGEERGGGTGPAEPSLDEPLQHQARCGCGYRGQGDPSYLGGLEVTHVVAQGDSETEGGAEVQAGSEAGPVGRRRPARQPRQQRELGRGRDGVDLGQALYGSQGGCVQGVQLATPACSSASSAVRSAALRSSRVFATGVMIREVTPAAASPCI